MMCSLMFVVIGLCLGGGLLFGSIRMRSRLQAIEDARPCKAGSPGTGLVKLQGTVKAVEPDELLVSPIDQQPCVYYRLVIEEFRQNTITNLNPLQMRTRTSGSWVAVVEDVQAVPILIADETGAVSVDPKSAQLDFQVSRTHANLFSSLPKELEESLRARYKIVTSGAFLPKQMRYTEVVIRPDQEVFAVGECELRKGQATLVKGENPVMMTFRTEQQVLRNGKISVMIMKGLAVAVPLVFLGLAIGIYYDLRMHQQALQGAAAKAEAEDPRTETIAKIKSKTAGLGERAWAARKLAESPVIESKIPDVAPCLNSLLDSNDRFHRESALLAIKQGWVSKVNEPALRRLLERTTEAKVQKEVTTALERLANN